MLLALAAGLSRIRDYYHHWSDVVAGFILGSFAAWFVVSCTDDRVGIPVYPSQLNWEQGGRAQAAGNFVCACVEFTFSFHMRASFAEANLIKFESTGFPTLITAAKD